MSYIVTETDSRAGDTEIQTYSRDEEWGNRILENFDWELWW